MTNFIRTTHKKQQSIAKSETALLRHQNIVVVFESNSTRQHALRSTPELGVEDPKAKDKFITWWSFEQISEAGAARESATKAARADMVVFSISPAGELPDYLKLWIEKWIANRKEREGALVCLLARPQAPGWVAVAGLKEIYLRHTALRAGMDYLSELRMSPGGTLPDSPDSCRQRARHVGSVLDEILEAGKRPQSISRI